MADPFDLDALANEVSDTDPFRFRWNSEDFTLPNAADIDWQVALRFETTPPILALRELLGDQLDRFTAKPITVGHAQKLIDAWMAHQGTTVGESEASSGS